MIINLRGTSGSGKSTIVQNVMKRYQVKHAVRSKDDARKRPIGYILKSPTTSRWLAVPGHYEIACGGCDTINSMDQVFAQVKEADAYGYDVLFEGAIVSTLARNVIELHLSGHPVHVISLNTPLDVCLDSINARREAKWRERQYAAFAYNEAHPTRKPKEVPPRPEPVDPKTTTQKFQATKSTHEKIVAAGIPAVWASRHEAEHLICQMLGVPVET